MLQLHDILTAKTFLYSAIDIQYQQIFIYSYVYNSGSLS